MLACPPLSQHLPAGGEQPVLHSVRVTAERGRPAVGHHPAARADQLPAGTYPALLRHLVLALAVVAAYAVVDLDKLWKAKREAGYSANNIRIMRRVLRKALGQAEREGIVPRNVAALSSAPRIRAKDGRTLTVEQARQLLHTTSGHRFDVAIMIALAYGMRRAEVLGLHWSAVDWEVGTLRVTHGVKRIKNRDKTSDRRTSLVVSELKTPKSRATVRGATGSGSSCRLGSVPLVWRVTGSSLGGDVAWTGLCVEERSYALARFRLSDSGWS